MTDIYSSSVVDLLNLDDTNGSTTIVDSSYSARTHIVAGAAVLSTTDPKWGLSSLHLPSTGSYVTTPGTTDFVFGTGDFTLEGWVKTSANAKAIFDFYTSGGPGWILYTSASGCLQLYTTVLIKTGAIPVNDDVWHHIAVSRVSGVVYFFVDGVLDGAGTAFTTDLTSMQTFFAIGAQVSTRNASYDFIGYIDDVRVTKGVGRYTTTFSAPSGTFSVDPPNTYTAPRSTITVFGGGSAALTAPRSAINVFVGGSCAVAAPFAQVFVGLQARADVALSAPTATLAAFGGGAVDLTVPAPTLSFLARYSYGDNALIFTAPVPYMASHGGANAALSAPTPTLAFTATGTALAIVELTAPAATLDSGGLVSETTNAALTVPMATLIGYGGVVCSVTIGAATLVSTGTGGGVASAQFTVPLAQLSASATAQNYGSANLIAPSAQLGAQAQAYLIAPGARLTAIGSATIVATYEAYALNLNHKPVPGKEPTDETTRYTNFPFTHVVRYQNSYFGANSTGLYLLEGTTDDGTPIEWDIQTATTDFGTPQLKTVEMAFFGGRFGPAAEITLFAGETAGDPYVYTTPKDTTAKNYRQTFGRGLKARYYALAAKGADELVLDSITLNIANLARRI